MFVQLFVGQDRQDALIQKQAKILAKHLPETPPTTKEADNDFYYWHFGTLAMVQSGGEVWQTWNKYLKETLVKAQTTNTTPETGSWAPVDRWNFYGGKLYTTSMAILTLQSYYRYDWTAPS